MVRDLAGHHAHPDKTIELNGRSQNNTRYRAFPCAQLLLSAIRHVGMEIYLIEQRRNLVSTSKLSLLPHSI